MHNASEEDKRVCHSKIKKNNLVTESYLGRLGPAREVVAFLSVGADKDKGVVASYQWVLVKEGVGASQLVGANYIIVKIINNKNSSWFFPFGFPH